MFSQYFDREKILVKIHIPKENYDKLKGVIDPTIVNRDSLMTATDVLGVIPPGGDFNVGLPGITTNDIAFQANESKITPKESSFRATWYTADEKQAKTGNDANTFGASGTLEVIDPPEAIRIPVVDARLLSADYLAHYGATLVPANTTVHGFNASPYPLAVVTYSVHPDYTKKYLFDENKGGGAFIERHIPPHAWMPLHPDCGGALILGNRVEKDEYKLLAVNIPFGYALVLKGNALHADSFLVGDYAMVLSATEDKGAQVSTVIFRKPNNEMQPVELVPMERKPDPLSEMSSVISGASFFRPVQKEHAERKKTCDSTFKLCQRQ